MATLYPDRLPHNADWTKRSWDLPPYKSSEFYAVVPRSELEQFKMLPVYQGAVRNGWITNDEWTGPPEGYCSVEQIAWRKAHPDWNKK